MKLKYLEMKDKQNSMHEDIPASNENNRPYRPQELDPAFNEKWELRSVVAVFRHGDRTPKQKMKMKTKDELFLRFFEKAKDNTKEIKLKQPREL